MRPTQLSAYRLFHDGIIELAQVEANGIRVDTDRLEDTISKAERNISRIEKHLKSSDVWSVWTERYGSRANLDSSAQLADILYKVLEYHPSGSTRLGNRGKTDAGTLAKIDDPFVRDYLAYKKLAKFYGTYLKGIKRELCCDYIHPVFNLHFVKTYRSSSDNPNFQNFPVRDPVYGKLIRKLFIPRDGHQLVEIDYSSIEVRIAACYTHDERLIRYINDPTSDMHRDMAMKLYMLDAEEVSKTIRYCAKNMYVFPEFYGSTYVRCSQNLWTAIDDLNLEMKESGIKLRKHLREKGIHKLGKCSFKEPPRRGTFEYHVQKVETAFWKDFSGYGSWKDQWEKDYKRDGGFDLLTGFRVDGVYTRNQILNTPIQGVAFHILLWSLIRLNRWLRANNMKTKIVGQIHDSILADVHEDEHDAYLRMAKRIMTEESRKFYPWIVVPLEVEAEGSGISWHDKQVISI